MNAKTKLFFILIIFIILLTLFLWFFINWKITQEVLQTRHTNKHIENTLILENRIQNLFSSLQLKHLVIWGHPLHSHTHSYIHEAFYNAGLKLNIDTHWVPQQTFHKTNTIVNYNGPVDNTLFITEGQVCDGMPQSNKSYYVFHFVDRNRTPFLDIHSSRILDLVYYSKNHPDIKFKNTWPLFDKFQRISVLNRQVEMPWATNLLPNEFYNPIEMSKRPKYINIIGQNGIAYENKIHDFIHQMNTNDNWKSIHRHDSLSQIEMINILRNCQCAPSLLRDNQKAFDYIPCRAMKTISYGQLCITTSKSTDDMLHHNTIYNHDEKLLANLFLAERFSKQTKIKQQNAYTLVRQRHTYLNRIEFLLKSFQICNNFNVNPNTLILNSTKKEKTHKILHLTCHKGLQCHLDFIGQQLSWDLTHLNLFETEKTQTVYNMTIDRANYFWNKYKSYFQTFETIIISDTAPLARIFLQHLNEFQGNIIIWVCNRFDYSDQKSLQSNEIFPDQVYYKLMNSTLPNRVKIISYTKIERCYALDKSVCWKGPFADTIIKPIGDKSIITTHKNTLIPSNVSKHKSKYVFIPPYINDTNCIDFNYLKTNNIQFYNGRYNGANDLIGFKCIVHIPYAASNLALFENLYRGIVYYIPSITFLKQLIHSKSNNWFSGGVERIEMSEWYMDSMKHLFVYFDSWSDLKYKLNNNSHLPLEKVTQSWAKQEIINNLNLWKILTF